MMAKKKSYIEKLQERGKKVAQKDRERKRIIDMDRVKLFKEGHK